MGTQTLSSLAVGSRGHSVAGRGHRCLGHPKGHLRCQFSSWGLLLHLSPLTHRGPSCTLSSWEARDALDSICSNFSLG